MRHLGRLDAEQPDLTHEIRLVIDDDAIGVDRASSVNSGGDLFASGPSCIDAAAAFARTAAHHASATTRTCLGSAGAVGRAA